MDSPASNELVFSFSKARLAGLAVSLVLLLATSFGGGFVTGWAWRPAAAETSVHAVALPQFPAVATSQRDAPSAAPPPDGPPAAAPAPQTTPGIAPAEAASTAPLSPPSPLSKLEAAAKLPAAIDAAKTGPATGPVSELQLAIIVGSFLDPRNAERVETELRTLGLEPQRLTRRAGAEKTWHAVRLGPYADWESASRFATQVRLQTGASPAIRPYQ